MKLETSKSNAGDGREEAKSRKREILFLRLPFRGYSLFWAGVPVKATVGGSAGRFLRKHFKMNILQKNRALFIPGESDQIQPTWWRITLTHSRLAHRVMHVLTVNRHFARSGRPALPRCVQLRRGASTLPPFPATPCFSVFQLISGYFSLIQHIAKLMNRDMMVKAGFSASSFASYALRDFALNPGAKATGNTGNTGNT